MFSHDDTCTEVEQVFDDEFHQLVIVTDAHIFFAFGSAISMAGKGFDFIERPKESLTLACLRQYLIAGNTRVFLAHVHHSTSHEVHHVFEIAMILLGNGEIEFSLFTAIIVVGHPFRQIALDAFEVLHTILRCLDGIITQIFRHNGGIDLAHLLAHETKIGLFGLLVCPSLNRLGFFLKIAIILWEIAIVPFNGILIIDAKFRRAKRYTAISRLRDVVVARIVHDGGSSAILLRESA